MATKPKEIINRPTMFEVVKGVPVPKNTGRGREAIYPFASMSVGDCFFAPRDKGMRSDGKDKRQNIINACSRSYVKKHNPSAKFTVRIVDDETVGCWRVA